MPPLRTNKVTLIRANSVCDTDAEFNSQITLNKQIEEGSWHALIHGSNAYQYYLGSMIVTGRNLRRERSESSLDMDKSAIDRLKTILRICKSEIKVRLEIEDQNKKTHTIWGKILPLTQAKSATIFLTEFESFLPNHLGHFSLHVEFTGISFRIETSPVQMEGNQVAWQLPSSAKRVLRRTVPRIALDWNLTFTSAESSPVHHNLNLVDLSPLGCSFIATDIELIPWQEISLHFTRQESQIITVPALVIEKSHSGRISCVFANNHDSYKDAFFHFLSSYSKSITFRQDATETWNCLEHNGYVDLLEGGQLRSVKEICIGSWNQISAAKESFQPVAVIGDQGVGTIASTQVSQDHWVPHSFATAVEKDLLPISEALYQSWPIYQLAQGRPSWFSTWYDSEKSWHNRFYQVFIHEHQNNRDCFSFVRRWYWSPDISKSKDNPQLTLRKFNPQKDQDLLALWLQRYGEQNSPVVRLAEEEFFVFKSWIGVIEINGEPKAIFPCIQSKLEVNPFGVFNVAHINIFDDTLKKDAQFVNNMVEKIAWQMHLEGSQRMALTLDYDCEIDLTPLNFSFFVNIKCLTAFSDHLGSLISNNALCFADMLARKT